jgi:pimeloyl-ACP methyl ester carboxylesterase
MGFTSHHRSGSGTPVVLLHGFTDTWRTWDLVRVRLERDHDVFAPTLLGHAGGPEVGEQLRRQIMREGLSDTLLADHAERSMDAAGIETAHIVGNSLGGYVALHLAERGRARSVTALAPAGGWPAGDDSFHHACRVFERMQLHLKAGAPLARAVTKTRFGRRFALRDIVERDSHIPRDLVTHLLRGAHACSIADDLLQMSDDVTWNVNGERIDCPVRIVWGTRDRILLHPVAGSSFRRWLPQAEWIELDGVGHCIQLDAPHRVVELVREQVERVERLRESAADSPLSA